MENEIIFRSRFRTQIAPRAVFVALMGISLCVGILIPFGVQPLQVESWWVVLRFALNSPLGLLIGLAFAGVAYVGAYLWSDTLVFYQTDIQHRCIPFPLVAQVGRLTSSESGWEWQDLQLSNQCDVPAGVAGFLVDAQERIWIARLGAVSVYSGLSFSDHSAEGVLESARYTETNSGYFAGELLQDPMGRLWSLDQSGKILVWLDGTVETLPKPLPEPLALLLASDWIPLILQYLGILSIFGILFFVWEANRYKGGKPPT